METYKSLCLEFRKLCKEINGLDMSKPCDFMRHTPLVNRLINVDVKIRLIDSSTDIKFN